MLTEAELQKKYKIGVAEWHAMFALQHGVCAICHCHQRYQSLAVDHCHKTGKVRGLLCVNCNRMLGKAFDSPIRLRNAAAYIEASRLPRLPVSADPPCVAIASSPASSPVAGVFSALIDEVDA